MNCKCVKNIYGWHDPDCPLIEYKIKKTSLDQLDLNQIESELEKLSPWPWFCKTDNNIFGDTPYITKDENSDLAKHVVAAAFKYKEDAQFCAKAPETIAALVKRMRELEKALFKIGFECKESSENLIDEYRWKVDLAREILKSSDKE